MSDFILNNLAVLIIFWLAMVILTSIFARTKNRSPIYWLIIGALFGFAGLVLVLLLPRKPDYSAAKPLDKMDSELKYLKMEKDYVDSKAKR